MERDDWIAVCAHQLQRQWRTVDPDQLDEVAADLWRDPRLRAMAPAQAAVAWLAPVAHLSRRPEVAERRMGEP
ncbi:hypothetical protein [Variovorax sp. J31P207]|uniref:hypothetical protein n=1 Tax=Variovorax sp. J31P207 TaxID=3053510 RepID=UPI002578193A|nr:hypothetical protein [Variovorax sp. J31P207]MDM0067874.1 hypothetical protein [Variovorax sp. J31P207]